MKLVDQGNTIVVIEHNLDVIKCGRLRHRSRAGRRRGGGQIVAEGHPEEVALNDASATGRFLAAFWQQRDDSPMRSGGGLMMLW